MNYVLPKLAYGLADLEPVISQAMLDVHYNKHHLNYVNTLNGAIGPLSTALANNDLETVVKLQQTISFNGGSHINHSMYWENLAPISGTGGKPPVPTSLFNKQIVQDWGTFDSLIKYLTKRTTEIKGSGWGWLVLDKATKKTMFMQTQNQDTIIGIDTDKVPLLAIDVWEHAYYIDYKNARANYMNNIWKIINWETVNKRYEKAISENN